MTSQGTAKCSDKSTIAKRCKESLNEFNARLYTELCKGEGNIFYSPLSIATCLQMVYHGSKGNTKQQTAKIMGIFGIEDEDILSFYNELLESMNKVQGEYDATKLTLANKVWIKDQYTVLDDYQTMLQQKLKAGIERNPFSNPAEAAAEVNSWVKESTGGMIDKLIQPHMINNLTRLILCNAIYFKGLWQFPFDYCDPEPFYLDAKRTTEVQMMKHRGSKKMRYGENDVARFVSVPYKGDHNINMMIILPQVPHQLAVVEQEMICKPGKLDEWYKTMTLKDVNLLVPKFKFEEEYDLKKVLCSLGMTDMFTEGVADFSGINGCPPGELHISGAVHKAVLSVDECGTEAAAATAMVALMSMAFEEEEEIFFSADQPFMFLIYGQREAKPYQYVGQIMFSGRVASFS